MTTSRAITDFFCRVSQRPTNANSQLQQQQNDDLIDFEKEVGTNLDQITDSANTVNQSVEHSISLSLSNADVEQQFDHDDVAETVLSGDDAPAAVKKVPKKPLFQFKWQSEFPWLVKLSENEAKCTICECNKNDKKNEWATGKTLTQWHKTTFQRHGKSRKHQENRLIPPQQASMVTSAQTAYSKAERNTIGLMCNILAAIQNEMSLNKVEFLHSLADIHIQRALERFEEQPPGGTQSIKLSAKHRSLYSTYKLMQSLNAIVTRSEMRKFRKALALCLHVDESTDIANNKLLLIYLTICSSDEKLSGEFYGVVLELPDRCDAETIAQKINLWLLEIGIKKQSLVMFTSDGAAVMLGRLTGVAQRLRSEFDFIHLLDYHCVCHRENLALKDAYQMSPAYLYLETLLRQTISHLACHNNLVQLKAVAEILQANLYLPRRIFEIRWLSRFQVVSNFIKSASIIVEFLKQTCEQDPVAQTLYNELSCSRTLMLLHHLHDLLSPLESLMLQLQKRNLHPFDAEKYTIGAIQHLENTYLTGGPIAGPSFIVLMNKISQKEITTSDSFTAEGRSQCEADIKHLANLITDSLKQRMWNNHGIIKDFKIFHTEGIRNVESSDVGKYGHKRLSKLIAFYKDPFEIDEVAVKQEWDVFKFQHLKPMSDTEKPGIWKQALRICINDKLIFPNLSKLAAVLSCFNAQNASVERGFSTLNRIRTRLRNRLSVPTIDMLMRLRLSTESYLTFDYHPALKFYANDITYSLGIKQKRKKNDHNAESVNDDDYESFNELIQNGF